ncbi:hypothetical protein Ciccas_008845, partial [Cichlidogyrus casuarinus]
MDIKPLSPANDNLLIDSPLCSSTNIKKKRIFDNSRLNSSIFDSSKSLFSLLTLNCSKSKNKRNQAQAAGDSKQPIGTAKQESQSSKENNKENIPPLENIDDSNDNNS